MAFPFPRIPVDGQVITDTASDGTVLVATYRQLKNEWEVKRVEPAPSTLTLTSGVAYTVTPASDGQVLTYDKKLNQWVGKAPVAVGGGSGGTFIKANLAAKDTPNPPDPTVPAQVLRAGMLQSTPENLHHELKYWDGAKWAILFGEDQIKQWIAAGSLFRGVIQESTLSSLPDVAAANRGFYWSWIGAPGYVVKKTDVKIGASLDGEILQVGDWIQSDGSVWVHVPGDLLSKQRWDSLGSFTPWSDTSWEKGSVVSYQKAFFRASALVSPGDLAPGVTPGDPTEVQKWVDITPVPHLGLQDLQDVNANVATPRIHGEVFQWDANIGEWVSSDVLQIGAVRFDDVGVGAEISGFADQNFAQAPAAEDDAYVPSVFAVKDYINTLPNKFLEELEDCTELASATDGQVPTWNDADSKWEPANISATLAGLTDATITTPKDGQHLVYKTDHWENQDAMLRYSALTEAQYNALATKDPNTLYLIRA